MKILSGGAGLMVYSYFLVFLCKKKIRYINLSLQMLADLLNIEHFVVNSDM